LPIYDFAKANEGLEDVSTERYYECCGKRICGGCFHSIRKSGNDYKCPFCNSDRDSKTDDERVEEIMKRVEANDAGAMHVLGTYYCHGQLGLQHDRSNAIELWKQATELGYSQAHYHLGVIYIQEGNLKKAKIHYEAAAMAGDEVARGNLAKMEFESMNFAYMELEFGKKERAVKHLRIAASAGCYQSMKNFMACFEKGYISRDEIDSILTAYNNSCAEMRSEARDKYILDLRTRPQPR
jgi:TPR repeat protein